MRTREQRRSFLVVCALAARGALAAGGERQAARAAPISLHPENPRYFLCNKVIADDETGFRGVSDEVYRTEGREFVIAGGALYNNLDYSFAVGFEDGTFAYPNTQPGGGSAALRRQLRILRDFITSVDFIRMTPDDSIVKAGAPPGGAARALVERGRTIAIYLRRSVPANAKEAALQVSREPGPSAPLQLEIPMGSGARNGSTR
jgi:hypothetical protein